MNNNFYLVLKTKLKGVTLNDLTHIHPGRTPVPSGLKENPDAEAKNRDPGTWGDIGQAKKITTVFNQPNAKFNILIYNQDGLIYIPYSPNLK